MKEDNKTVFISYCWTTKEHEKWVLDLATRLMNSGVNVKLDKWDLKPRNDTYAFMEQMVTNTEVDKVLMICESGYKRKADSRNGGVGTEVKIITPEVYKSVNQEKFIPIIVERTEKDFMGCVPAYARGILGIDMTSDDNYGEGFEELLRCIFDKPRFKKPELGQNLPSFLDEENEVRISGSLKIKNTRIVELSNKEKYRKVIEVAEDFMDDLDIELQKFIIEDINEARSKCRTYIDDLKPLRDEYLVRVKNLINCLDDEELLNILIEDLEKIYKYTEYQGSNSYNDYMLGHFKMFIHEIFLWICTLLFKYKKYDVLSSLLISDFYVVSKFGDIKKSIGSFYDRCAILDSYKTSECNRISIHADKLIERSSLESKDYKGDLIATDLLIYYAAHINSSCVGSWFPRLYIYDANYSITKMFDKMNDEKYFNRIKGIFKVDSLDELIENSNRIFPIGTTINGYPRAWGGIPHLQSLIKNS